jgi:catechol 2,3-dioxygenase-like lactoylglutathione lyase family enzyme
MPIVRTYGLTHTALVVSDLDRSIAFYGALLGAEVRHRNERGADITTPGCHDIISLQLATDGVTGEMGQLGHIGFRLQAAEPLETLSRAVESAGGTVTESGFFTPDEPYVFAKDPDGYVIELWYEP